jgi:hypothetical protein
MFAEPEFARKTTKAKKEGSRSGLTRTDRKSSMPSSTDAPDRDN